MSLYEAFGQSWNSGIDAGIAYIAEHNYPDFHFTTQECRSTYIGQAQIASISEIIVPNGAEMVLDPAWRVPDGRYAGLHPSGRVYAVTLNYMYSYNDGQPIANRELAHVAIVDDNAYFFHTCEPKA